MDKSFASAILTASAAFSGALIAQVISHFLSMRRENSKYDREIYQCLFSPIIPEVLSYFDFIVQPYGGNKKETIKGEDIKKEVINHISNSLKYATPSIILKFDEVRKYKYFDDLSGEHQPLKEMELFFVILEEYYKLVRKNKILDKTNLNGIIHYQVYYLLWISAYEVTSTRQGLDIAWMYCLIDQKLLEDRTLKKIKKLKENKSWDELFMYFASLTRGIREKEDFIDNVNKHRTKVVSQ